MEPPHIRDGSPRDNNGVPTVTCYGSGRVEKTEDYYSQ